MRALTLLVSLTGCLSIVACGGEDGGDNPPPGGNNNRIVERYPGGGTGGGAIEGKFSLFVEDDDGIVAGATVLVEGGGKSLTAISNAEGRVDFEDAALTGPITVHIFKTGYTFQSIVNLRASVATFGISKIEPAMPPPPMPPPSATVKGNVTGWELIPGMDPKLAIVEPIGTNIFRFTQPERAAPNNQFRTNVAANWPPTVVLDYEAKVDIRAKAMVLIAGPIIMGLLQEEYVGFAGGLNATAGSTVMKDIAISHKLDQDISVSVTGSMDLGAPAVGLDIATPDNSGVVGLNSAMGGSQTFKAPALNGTLSGAKLIAWGDMSSASGSDSAGAYVQREVSGASAALMAGALPGKPMATGRAVTAATVPGAQLHVFSFVNASRVFVWSVVSFDGASVTLPAVPMGITDPLTGRIDVSVNAQTFGGTVDLNNAKFGDFAHIHNIDSTGRATQIMF